MKNKSLLMLDDCFLQLHEEFEKCDNQLQFEEIFKKAELYNRDNNHIPTQNIGLEEFMKKYDLTKTSIIDKM